MVCLGRYNLLRTRHSSGLGPLAALPVRFRRLLVSILFCFGCSEDGSRQQSSPSATPRPAPITTHSAPTDSLWAKSFNLSDYEHITGLSITSFAQAPLFDSLVSEGALPPVEERLPSNPLVVMPWENLGEYGGELRYASTSPLGDIYLRHFNEVRLLELRPEPQSTPISKWILGTVEPGVLEHWEQSKDATLFTFRIRAGLRWSDGIEVTSEDARFCIEEIVLDEDLYPVPQDWSHWGGKPVEVEIVDERTFTLKFAKSFGLFVPRLVMWRWWWLLLPSHYLKQFHRDYTSPEELEPLIEAAGYDEWPIYYQKTVGRGWGVSQFVPGVVPGVESYPTLDPWLHVHQPNPGDFVLQRNPYYYKIDPAGRQLPYIDRLNKIRVQNAQVVILKIIAGETDFQRDLPLGELPLLKRNEENGNYHTAMLPDPQDYRLIFPINLSPADPVLKEIVQDVRFRQALSLALNRHEIRDVLLLGLGRTAQLSPLPDTPWFDKAFASAFAEYDPDRANQLLDDMGLAWDDDHEFRLRPDGEKLFMRLDVSVDQPEWVAGAELAREYWRSLGIDIIIKPTQQFWNMLESNQNHLTAWHANGATPIDDVFISAHVMTHLWHQWHLSGGELGEEPPEWMQRVYENQITFFSTPSEAERTQAGKEIFRTLSEQLWAIGVVAETPVPIIYSNDLRNIGIAEQRGIHATVVADAADQWHFGSAERLATAH